MAEKFNLGTTDCRRKDLMDREMRLAACRVDWYIPLAITGLPGCGDVLHVDSCKEE